MSLSFVNSADYKQFEFIPGTVPKVLPSVVSVLIGNLPPEIESDDHRVSSCASEMG